MNLRDLEYFIAAADLGSFSRAAQQCCISQPTLSNQIRKLEDELGVALFERLHKKIVLTETGARIADSARRALLEAESIRDIARRAGDALAGELRLGAFPSIATYLFPSFVPVVHREFPKVSLVLVEDKSAGLVSALRGGAIDAAILALPVDDDLLESCKLFDDEFRLAVSAHHPLARKRRVSESDLLRQRLLLLDDGHCLRDQSLEVCRRNGGRPDNEFRATNLETLRAMVRLGVGMTLMPAIAAGVDDAQIRYIPFQSPAPKRQIGLVWRKNSARLPLIFALGEKLVEKGVIMPETASKRAAG